MIDWKVLVVCQNEEKRVKLCIESVCTALKGKSAEISVLVNESTDKTLEISCEESMRHKDITISIYYIKYGDKSNAINQFLYSSLIYTEAKYYAFIDGHICVAQDLFDKISKHFEINLDLICVNGAASNGRTSAMLSKSLVGNGAVYGQCFVLKLEFISKLRSEGIRLPIGLYRGDGLLGSMIAHDLDAIKNKWSNNHATVAQDAKYTIESLSIFSIRALKKQFRRLVRQSRGNLENWAIKSIIYQKNYHSLPLYADDMLRQQDEIGWPAARGVQLFLRLLAVRHFRRAKPKPAVSILEPTLIFSNKQVNNSCSSLS